MRNLKRKEKKKEQQNKKTETKHPERGSIC